MSALSDLYFKRILVTEDSSLDQWHAQKMQGEQQPVSPAPTGDSVAIHVLVDQFKKLTPEQQQGFLKAVTQAPVAQEDTGSVAALSVESAISPISNIAAMYGYPPKNQPATGVVNKVKVLGLPPGTSAKYFNAQVGGTYKIVDRNLYTVTITGDNGQKVTLPKHLVQFTNG